MVTFSFLEGQLLNIYQHVTAKNSRGPVRFDCGACQQGQQRTAAELGNITHFPLQEGLQGQETGLPRCCHRLHQTTPAWAVPIGTPLSSQRSTRMGDAPREGPGASTKQAMACKQPHDPPWTRPPPSSCGSTTQLPQHLVNGTLELGRGMCLSNRGLSGFQSSPSFFSFYQ